MADMGMDQLDDRARKTLDSERPWWKYVGAKETAIRDTRRRQRSASRAV